MKLIKLPNGDWLNPEFLIAIRKGERVIKNGWMTAEIPSRVIVDFRVGMNGHVNSIIIECADDASCDAMADKIAEQCNTKP